MQTLKNDILSIAVDNHGAELTSINKNGVEPVAGRSSLLEKALASAIPHSRQRMGSQVHC